MRRRWFVIVPLVVLVAILLAMVLYPASASQVDAAALSRAEDEGWRKRGAPEDSRAGPFDVARLRTQEYERPLAGGFVAGKFYVVEIKSPVWLPSFALRGIADDYLKELSLENGVILRRTSADGAEDGTGAAVLEYAGKPTDGSILGTKDVGVLARIIPCDFAGGVVVSAGFGRTAMKPVGFPATSEDVYTEEVKGLLVPAVSCG